MRLYNKRKGKDYKAMTRVSLIAFLAEAPNLIITIISAIISYTPVIWVDTVNSLGETMHCFIVFLVSRGIQKNNEDKYNFGVDKLESFSSFCCDCLVIICMLAVSAGAVYGIVHPTLPADNLLLYVILKAINSVWDAAFLLGAIKAAKAAKSRLADSEVRNYAKALTFDLIIGVVVGITYFFRTQEWISYANPIVSIVLVLVFIVIYLKKLKESVAEITNKSIALLDQDRIFDIVLSNTKIVEKIEEVNCRRANNTTFIEVCVKMNDNSTYKEQIDYLDYIRAEVRKFIPNSIVKLVIGQDYNLE